MVYNKYIGIIGGTGTIGSIIVKYLLQLQTHFHVLIGGRRSIKEISMSTFYNSERLKYNQMNYNNDVELDNFCSQCLLVINAVGPSFKINDKIALHALRNNCHYIDIGGYGILRDLLKPYEKSIEAQKLCFIIGVGWMPGISGVFSKTIIETHLNSPENTNFNIYYGAVDNWSYSSTYDLAASSMGKTRSYVYSHGKEIQVSPFRYTHHKFFPFIGHKKICRPPALSRCELRRRMPVAESAVAVIGRTPDPFQPLPARSTSEFGSIHKKSDRRDQQSRDCKENDHSANYFTFHIEQQTCISEISYPEPSNRFKDNPKNRKSAASQRNKPTSCRRKAAGCPSDLYSGASPVIFANTHRPLPAFPKKAETVTPPRSPALRRPNPKRATFSRLLGRNLIHSRPNPVIAPIPTPFTLFYYGKTRKTRHPLHGHAARPRSECRRYPQVAHSPRFPGRPRLASGGLYRPHPPGRQRRTARSQQRRPHGRSLGDHQRRLRLQRHQPPHRIRRRSRRRRHDPLRYPHSAAKERPRTLRPGFRRPISRRSRRRA